MGLSSLNKFESKENSDRLFFDHYRFSLKLRMLDFSCLRYMYKSTKTIAEIESIVTRRFSDRIRYSSRMDYHTFPSPSDAAINAMRLDNLLDLLHHMWPIRDQVKIMFSGDWGYIYSNDKHVLEDICNKHYIHSYYIKEAVITKPKNTIVLKSSPYKFRSFLRCKQFTDSEKTQLVNYLENQSDLKISRGLVRWLKYSNWHWSRSYHYFDHNDSKIELMLRLIFPDLLRTTMPIIEVNN